MATAKSQTIRFAVGSQVEYRSAVWRLWTQKNEVYLGARDLAGTIKLSMHSSGIWRMAWTSESGILVPGSSDRVEKRWKRPSEFRPGWVQGPSVVIPDSGLTTPFSRSPASVAKPVAWFDPPKSGYQQRFTVLFALPEAPDESWNTVFRSSDKRLGKMGLDNGETVVLFYREVPMEPPDAEYFRDFAADMKIRYQSPPEKVEGASVFIIDADDAGYPYIVDLPLGEEHVVVQSTTQ